MQPHAFQYIELKSLIVIECMADAPRPARGARGARGACIVIRQDTCMQHIPCGLHRIAMPCYPTNPNDITNEDGVLCRCAAPGARRAGRARCARRARRAQCMLRIKCTIQCRTRHIHATHIAWIASDCIDRLGYHCNQMQSNEVRCKPMHSNTLNSNC